MEGEEENDSQSNKDEVMCHAMLWNEPGKAREVSGRNGYFHLVLKDKHEFSFRESGEENSGEKKQQSTDSGNRNSLWLKFKVVQGKYRKGHQNDYLRPN